MKLDMSLSKELIHKAKQNVAGGTSSTMRLPTYHLPLVIKRADGVRVWDADDNELIDMNMGYGPLIFGHRSPIVVDAINKEMELRGTILGFVHELSFQVAELIKKSIPSIELLRFSSSGTEVGQTAVRLARAYTKRSHIVIFEGHYHGSSDAVFHKYHAQLQDIEDADIIDTLPGCEGMGGAPRNVYRIPWNNFEVLEKVFKEKGETIAAVIMEPVMGNAGVIPPVPRFLSKVRDITKEYNSLLIFDEIITGFRVARGGAQERYGVESDLTMISKAMNGGVPISAIGGRREIMELLVEGRVFHGGVASGNPLCLAATLAVQKEYEKRGEEIYIALEDKSNMLRDGIIEIFNRLEVPVIVQDVGAMISMAFVESKDIKRFENYRDIKRWSNTNKYIKFQHELQCEGVYIHPNHFEPWYLSTSHSYPIIEDILDKIEKVGRRINWNDKELHM